MNTDECCNCCNDDACQCAGEDCCHGCCEK
ncbi:hypothetical protein SAMN05216270_11648 [Glycomyces harbinensis]|uniref:Metallothionein n=1 Tax=Glycomyces harbinensis TaxID=58114 RepID=A0A1G7BAN6_9ACTN|nr:hypothetical protein SAMN05216270_11648 [Glycomyces harbinensis]